MLSTREAEAALTAADVSAAAHIAAAAAAAAICMCSVQPSTAVMPNPVHRVWMVTQLCLLLAMATLATVHHANAQPLNRRAFSGGDALLPTSEDVTSWGADGAVLTAAAPMRSGKQEPVTCPAGVQLGNPDFGKGQFSQGVSYGIPMMQVGRTALYAYMSE
jgi:hypothetical protein